MLKTILQVFVILAIALVGGAASVWYVMEEVPTVDSLAFGAWTIDPDIGTASADPYARARFAREGQLALGASEGMKFVARTDSRGLPLLGTCRYRLEGPVIAARFWTLHVRYGAHPDRGEPGTATLHSIGLLRSGDGGVLIRVSRRASPGNWLKLEARDPFRLVLTAYDTSEVGAAQFDDVAMPEIVREGCDG